MRKSPIYLLLFCFIMVFYLSPAVFAHQKQTDIDSVNSVLARVFELAKREAINYPVKKERAHLVVFTDISCQYCQKLHEEIKEYNALGISISYLAYPRAGLHSTVADQMNAIWCNRYSKIVLNNAFDDPESIPDFSCSVDKIDIAQHMSLAKELGLYATPTLVLPNGQLITGYLSPLKLKQQLDEILDERKENN